MRARVDLCADPASPVSSSSLIFSDASSLMFWLLLSNVSSESLLITSSYQHKLNTDPHNIIFWSLFVCLKYFFAELMTCCWVRWSHLNIISCLSSQSWHNIILSNHLIFQEIFHTNRDKIFQCTRVLRYQRSCGCNINIWQLICIWWHHTASSHVRRGKIENKYILIDPN